MTEKWCQKTHLGGLGLGVLHVDVVEAGLQQGRTHGLGRGRAFHRGLRSLQFGFFHVLHGVRYGNGVRAHRLDRGDQYVGWEHVQGGCDGFSERRGEGGVLRLCRADARDLLLHLQDGFVDGVRLGDRHWGVGGGRTPTWTTTTRAK